MDRRIAAGDHRLNLGDTGAAVSAVQRQLKAAGLYLGPVSGTFDDATRAAVEAFQTAKKMGVSGEVGKGTLGALKKVNLFVKDGFQKSPAHVGQSGTDVKRAESKLAELGFLSKSEVDGVFDKDTAAAVKRYGVADGEVSDKATRIGEKFYSELSKASRSYHHDPYRRREVGKLKPHARLDELTGKQAARSGGVKFGDKGRSVLNIEKHLEAAGYELGKPNATYGSRTRAAVEAFQARSGLPKTGVVDASTWKKLKGALFAAGTATSPAQRQGERDRAVLGTEKLLKKLGYKKVKADGLYNQATENAVERFQKKHHLGATGNVNARTLKALKKAVASAGQSGFAKKVLDLARSQLGTGETPMGSNHQKYSAYFNRGNEPWCADFVSYIYSKAGKKLNEPWTPSMLQMLRNNGTYTRNHPKPGDIVMFDWSPGSGDSADHTGIVEKVYRKNGQLWVQTIEGNLDNMVKRRNVPVSWSMIAGFGTVK
ncbi:MAG: peptidoglycan-binding protein [Myxococcaceae bacterium]